MRGITNAIIEPLIIKFSGGRKQRRCEDGGAAALREHPWASELVQLDPIWKRTAADDLHDAEEAVKAHEDMYEGCAELRDTGLEAMKQLDMAVQTKNFANVTKNWQTYCRSLTDFFVKGWECISVTKDQKDGLAYFCYAREGDARELRKLNKVHAGKMRNVILSNAPFQMANVIPRPTALATPGVRLETILEEGRTNDREEDTRQVLYRFAERLENEKAAELPYEWNPKKNENVDINKLGLDGNLKWPRGLEEYAKAYIGSKGHWVPEDKRNQSDLQPFVTVELCRPSRSGHTVSM